MTQRVIFICHRNQFAFNCIIIQFLKMKFNSKLGARWQITSEAYAAKLLLLFSLHFMLPIASSHMGGVYLRSPLSRTHLILSTSAVSTFAEDHPLLRARLCCINTHFGLRLFLLFLSSQVQN